jgi:hypothetical protein
MSAVRRVTAGALAGGEAWIGLASGYLLALLVLSRRGPAQPDAAGGTPLRIAVLVPAHDEQDGVGATVASLLAQDYPAERREVIVIADNCTDATAARACEAGATVWERVADERGKGQALAWALERLDMERGVAFDAVAMVDADCRASANLLAAFDASLRGGARAVQAAYDVANPEASATAALRWAGFALMHRVRPRGRRALGLSADLFGTGMAFRTSLLREHPWRSFSVTEDAEYHLQLVAAGVPVGYVEAASVSSPMPLTREAAHAQQLRWESGNAVLARRTAPRLAIRGARERDKHLLHAGLEQLVPPQSALLLANAAAFAGAAALRRPALVLAALATGAMQAVYVLAGLRAAGAPPEVYRALRGVPRLAAGKLAVLARVAIGRGATAWVRTPREAGG